MPIELLENRKLFAVGPTATLASGVLTIEGTAGDDYVFITNSRDGETLTVSSGLKGDAESRTKTPFAVADVTSIVVNAGDGNDTVRTARRVDLRMAVDGGGGDDNLGGGTDNDALNGGDGDDRVFGFGGDDTLVGGIGEDKVFGGDGDDDLSGGDGADLLHGGRGDDMLLGEAGNDRLISIDFDGTDTVDGGDNGTPTDEDPGDSAIVDDNDDVTNVEDTINPISDDDTDGEIHDGPWGHFYDFIDGLMGRFFGRGGFFRGGPFAGLIEDGSLRVGGHRQGGECDDSADDTDDSTDDKTDDTDDSTDDGSSAGLSVRRLWF